MVVEGSRQSQRATADRWRRCERRRAALLHGSVTFFAELSGLLGGIMIRRSTALIVMGVLSGALWLSGCTGDNPPSGQPSFYLDLAQPGAALDANAAQSMISGYRGNNGIAAVTIDPDLMRLAGEQAQAMAASGRLDHDLGHPFQERIRKSGFDARVAVENIGAGYHTLAEAFSGWRDSPPHRANMLNAGVTRMGIAAVYTPKSKYKVFWSLILADRDERKG
jgi:hypothetical protein